MVPEIFVIAPRIFCTLYIFWLRFLEVASKFIGSLCRPALNSLCGHWQKQEIKEDKNWWEKKTVSSGCQ
jgi:hypothetical protein